MFLTLNTLSTHYDLGLRSGTFSLGDIEKLRISGPFPDLPIQDLQFTGLQVTSTPERILLQGTTTCTFHCRRSSVGHTECRPSPHAVNLCFVFFYKELLLLYTGAWGCGYGRVMQVPSFTKGLTPSDRAGCPLKPTFPQSTALERHPVWETILEPTQTTPSSMPDTEH